MSYDQPLTLDIVKEQLGIVDETGVDPEYTDTQITSQLYPAQSKFYQVSNYSYNSNIQVIYEEDSNLIKVYVGPDSTVDYFNFGDIILSEHHADGTYVLEAYRIYNTDDDTGCLYFNIKVSNNATSDSKSIGSTIIISYNISQYTVISQIVSYLISQQTVSASLEKTCKNQKIGPVSITYSDGDINLAYGLPNKIVQAITTYAGTC